MAHIPALNATPINEPETLLDPSKFGIVGVEAALHKFGGESQGQRLYTNILAKSHCH